MRSMQAFTLIELLVVVTVIVLLLALLAPALDRAVYQAELATCGARLHGIGVGVVSYALDFKRWYPHRQIDPPPGSGGYLDQPPPMRLTAPTWNFDFRPTLRNHIRLDLLQDPFCPKVDIERSSADTAIDADYPLWFGWQYLRVNSTRQNIASGRGMLRLGDRLEWNPPGATQARFFNVLAGDWDDVNPNVWSAGTQPDSRGVMAPVKIQDGGTPGSKWTYARWTSRDHQRGTIDPGFLFDDASVSRLPETRRGQTTTGIDPGEDEPRITRVSLRVFDNSPETTAMPAR